MVAIWGVMRFYHLLKSGMSWKGPEAIELWYLPVLTTDISDGPPANDESLLVGYDSSSEMSFPESYWSRGKLAEQWKIRRTVITCFVTYCVLSMLFRNFYNKSINNWRTLRKIERFSRLFLTKSHMYVHFRRIAIHTHILYIIFEKKKLDNWQYNVTWKSVM